MFESFSKINYNLNGQTLELTDIFKSIKIDSKNFIDLNTIKNTNFERPDQLAQKIYGDPKLFWVHLALNDVKNPFRQWFGSDSTQTLQNNIDYDTKVFQFGNTSKYLPQSPDAEYFDFDKTDSYLGVDLTGIEQDDIIIFETGSGSFELKTYGAGQNFYTETGACVYPHYGQADIPDEFLNRNNIIQISCGSNFTACLDNLGYIWVWGQDFNWDFNSVGTRLYQSKFGNYKHIDTTNNKILAVNFNGDIECFGDCADWIYGGQTNIKKSFWTSGITLAGVGIKTDDSITVFGPIVSTNNLLQYCSDVSCADNYCLGVITGPQSSGTVIGFGPTGYFSQIGQNSFYSKQLTDLGTITPTNPIYPFTDSGNQIIKNYADGVLEVSINDLTPFTSPEGDPDKGYRSDYHAVYGSDGPARSLIGFTDKNTYSKEGYILNDPKTFAGGGATLFENDTYEYTEFYNTNRKPNRFYNLVQDSKTKYTGITFINGMDYTSQYVTYQENIQSLTPGLPKTVINLKQFTPKYTDNYYDNNSINNYFGSKIKYAEAYGISFPTYTPAFSKQFLNNHELESGLTFLDIRHVDDIFPLDIFITSDKKIHKIVTPFIVVSDRADIWPVEQNYTLDRKYVKVYGYDSGVFKGVTVDYINSNYFDTFGPFKSWSQNSYNGLWVLLTDGTPYFICNYTLASTIGDGTDAVIQQYFPPPGFTFEKIEAPHVDKTWNAGLKNDGKIVIWGDSSSLQTLFGAIPGTTYFVEPGLTAKDIFVNMDNIIAIKNTGTISMIGGLTSIHHSIEAVYDGLTVSNAIKVIGPTHYHIGDPIFIQTTDNALKYGFNTKISINEWKPYGFTLAGYEYPDSNVKYINYTDDIYNNYKSLDIASKLESSDIKDINGTTNYLEIEKTNGTRIIVIPYVYFYSPIGLYAFAAFHGAVRRHMGIDQTQFKTSQISYSGGIYKIHKTKPYIYTTASVAGIGSPSLSTDDIAIHQIAQNSEDYFPRENSFENEIPNYASMAHGLAFNNRNKNSGIQKATLSGFWRLGEWNWNGLAAIGFDRYEVVTGGITLDNYGFSEYGAFTCWTSKDKKVISPLILSYKQYSYPYIGVDSIVNNYKNMIMGNGFVITLNSNNSITFVSGDKVPFNFMGDFSGLSTVHTINFSDGQADFEFWEDSLAEKVAIGLDRFYTYQPSYSRNNLNYWGTNDATKSIVPPGLTYQQIDCFYTHCCGIRQDGKVECWGTDNTGIYIQQADGNIVSGLFAIPSNLGVCEKVAVGYDHNCAEDVFGNITCWGKNEYGQTVVPSAVNDGTENLILDCGQYFSVVQKTDGRIVMWGLGTTGPSQLIPISNPVPTELQLES